MHLAAAEEVVDTQATQILDPRVSLERVRERREEAHGDACGGSPANHRPDLRRRQRWDRDHNRVDEVRHRHVSEEIGPAQDFQSVDPLLRNVIIDEADREQSEVGRSAQVTCDRAPRLPGTDDERAQEPVGPTLQSERGQLLALGRKRKGDAHERLPPARDAIASATRSTSSSVKSGYMGRETTSSNAASAFGNDCGPSRDSKY